MPNPQNRNDRRKGEERSETLIIPHITKEMLETARRMAEEGASRAEIEKAISAMQSPAQPASSPASRPAQHAAPAPQPMAAPPERKHRIIPTSRPRLSAEERAALRQQMQMGETQAETPQPEPEQEALRQEAARRAANRPAWFGRRQTAQNDSQEAARRAAQALAAAPRAPEAPAAPRAPFPFAAPEQDEPVPAIHIDARVLAFLRKYDAAPDQLDTQELTDALLAAMQRGLRGEAGGLPMLPAYLAPHGHVAAPEGKRVAVIDAGGTNFRVATVHYEFGQPILEDERTLPMPGSERDADWMDFIRLAADALEPLLDRVTQIGICFSYPAENTPELDAKVLGMTKEVQLTGWEDHLVGADLAEELERRGCTKLPITVINDTPATYLSGSTTIANNYANGFAGLVNGTGTNTCCLLPVRAIEKLGRDADGEMLVNLESGSFTDVPQSAFDKALDAASAAPGAYRFEKMTSGRYLGKLSRLALIAAAKDGLFAPETADKLRALDVLTAADADAFGADPDCGAIAALSDAADADRKTAAMVIQSVFGRAAKAIVANIAAIVFLTDGAKNRYRPMVVAVDGSLFRYSTLLRPAVSEELEAFLVQKHQRYCVCKPVPNASAIGTAAASLLQD